MKSIRILQLILLGVFLSSIVLGCQNRKGYKTKSGLIFYVYGDRDRDSTLRPGSYIKLDVKKFVNDSMVQNTHYSFPEYQQIMPGAFYPYEPAEIFPFFKKGDSIILIQDADTLLKRSLFYTVPPYVKPGDKIVTHYKVLDVFENDSLVRIDQEKAYPMALENNRKTSAARLKSWLKERKIKADLTSDTIFIEKINEGAGDPVQSDNIVSIRFIATTLSGTELGRNTDTAQAPASYKLHSGYMPQGVDEGIAHLKVGDKARLYIPAMKAFGAAPPPGMSEGFQDMIFEVEVLDAVIPETDEPSPSGNTAEE